MSCGPGRLRRRIRCDADGCCFAGQSGGVACAVRSRFADHRDGLGRFGRHGERNRGCRFAGWHDGPAGQRAERGSGRG
jgi:hypothetical protein